MPKSSSSAANVPGTGSPSTAVCTVVREVEKPSAPALIRGPDDIGHGSDVFRGRRLISRAAVTHDVAAHRAMGNLRGDVERARHLLDRIEIVREALPAPFDALGECAAGDVLDALHHLDEPVLFARPYRREADTAIAHHDRGDAVPGRRSEQRIPADLPVVVRVDVDEAGGDHQPVRIHRAPRRFTLEVADLGDDPVVNRYISLPSRLTGSVNERAATDNQVVHEASKSRSGEERLLTHSDTSSVWKPVLEPDRRPVGPRAGRRKARSWDLCAGCARRRRR